MSELEQAVDHFLREYERALESEKTDDDLNGFVKIISAAIDDLYEARMHER